MLSHSKLLVKGTIIVLALCCVVTSLELNGPNRSTQTNEAGELVFVSVLFRHGDRTPIHFFPNDPYNNNSYWPDGHGQLTNSGKQQAYELGKWFRSCYDALLTQHYSPDVLYIESSDFDRTLMSAQSVLAGMYPPKGRQNWDSNIGWQPIPVHTTPQIYDKKFARAVIFGDCPGYKNEYKKLLESQEIQELNSKFSDVFWVLNNNTGKNISTIPDIYWVYDTLFIENFNNLTLPDWTRSGNIFQRFAEVTNYYFTLFTWTPKLARLWSGTLVEDMVSHMTIKANVTLSDSIPKMWMYSGHDSTISSLLNSLKVFDPHFPPYASAVLVELRKNAEGNHFVMLFYRNSTIHEPYLLTLPGCASMCPLDTFVEICKPLIPGDWDKECKESRDTQ